MKKTSHWNPSAHSEDNTYRSSKRPRRQWLRRIETIWNGRTWEDRVCWRRCEVNALILRIDFAVQGLNMLGGAENVAIGILNQAILSPVGAVQIPNS